MSLPGHFPTNVDATEQGRMSQSMLVLLVLHRIACLMPAVLTCAYAAYHGSWAELGINLALVVAVTVWNLALFRIVQRRGRFPALLVQLDVVLVGLVLLLLTTTTSTAPSWGGLMMLASGSLVGAALTRPWAVTGSVLALVAIQTVLTLGYRPGSGSPALALGYAISGQVCFTLAAGFTMRYLRTNGRHLDRINARRLAVEAESAADHARYVARLAHHRILHDTVLTTLTLIARGTVDPARPEVRQRCARDAEVVRALLGGGWDPEFGTIGEALRDVVGELALLGLRVRYQGTPLAAELPPQVVGAVRAAAREALINVVKHAGVDRAWLTVTGEGRMVRVTIVDRGRGFDAAAVPPGFGFRHSIIDRVAEVGGRVRVSSELGAGTCVELTWTR